MSNIRILYVEDEPFLARVVKESLESRKFEVCLVGDGAQVIQKFCEFKPHVCVLDVMLPNRDGFEIAIEIRKTDPALPLIFLTAKTQVDDVLKGFESGGNDYLRKPFSIEELIVRIKNLIGMRAGAGFESPVEDIRKLGSYTFYPQNYILKRGESIKKLSHRENLILQFLSEDIRHPVKRRDILLKVWGDDSFYNSRNLDVYITRIREYFSADSSVRIETIKGVGYQFYVEE